jgi:hypothetical protein
VTRHLTTALEALAFAALAAVTFYILVGVRDPGARVHTHDGVHWHAHPGVK